MFFWRSSARRSIVLRMSSVASGAAGAGAANHAGGPHPAFEGVAEAGHDGILRAIALRRNQSQVGDAHEAELAREGQRLIAALLLGEARDPVLAGVIDADLAALLDRKSTRARKKGVSQIILGAGGGGTAQFRRPPLAG